MFKPFAIAALLALSAGTVQAQNAKPAEKPAEKAPAKTEAKAETKLVAGDKAPALEVEKFIKGSPITGYEKGKVYVVEFWATWCGPCKASIPHLTELQKEYKDRGLTVVGVNIWEDKAYNDGTLGKATKFVEEQGDKMNYTVAFDGATKKMDKAFMQAAARNGIPSSFVVDGEGKVAFIGHPSLLEYVIPDVIAGTWDVKTGPAKAEASRKSHEFDDAVKSKDAEALNAIAWNLVDPERKVKNPDLALALKAATQANEITKGEDPAILDTLARVYWVQGDKKKAAEIQAKAVELAGKNEKFKEMRSELEERLNEYKK